MNALSLWREGAAWEPQVNAKSKQMMTKGVGLEGRYVVPVEETGCRTRVMYWHQQ